MFPTLFRCFLILAHVAQCFEVTKMSQCQGGKQQDQQKNNSKVKSSVCASLLLQGSLGRKKKTPKTPKTNRCFSLENPPSSQVWSIFVGVLHACLVHHSFIVFRTPQCRIFEVKITTLQRRMVGRWFMSFWDSLFLWPMYAYVSFAEGTPFDGIFYPSSRVYCVHQQYPMNRKERFCILNDLSRYTIYSSFWSCPQQLHFTRGLEEFLDGFGHMQRQGHWYMGSMCQKLGTLNYSIPRFF